jgi:two-component system, chemotaxis family, protein-glutamate methylesterase/glutaminase
MDSERIVVIGASAGGVRALQSLAPHLEPGFPAPILVVQHIGAHPSILPELLGREGSLPAMHGEDGAPIESGRICVAPPDHHMMVEGATIRLSRGAKEHHTRPAIDPLFRSAAVSWGPAVIGVVLTGLLDDGTAGLQAIKKCGGTVVVQDPADAEAPSMPRSALRYVEVDHCVSLAAMGRLLHALANTPAARCEAGAYPPFAHENELALGKGDFVKHLQAIGRPSTYTCPDCDGALWEIDGAEPPRFRCHTGHAYTLRTLYDAQAEATDGALWSALRALHEKELLLTVMADAHQASDDPAQAARLRADAEELARHTAALRKLLESIPTPPE